MIMVQDAQKVLLQMFSYHLHMVNAGLRGVTPKDRYEIAFVLNLGHLYPAYVVELFSLKTYCQSNVLALSKHNPEFFSLVLGLSVSGTSLHAEA